MPGITHARPVGSPILLFQGGHTGKTGPPASPCLGLLGGKDQASTCSLAHLFNPEFGVL